MILFLISDCIIIGLSIALLCYCKKIDKRFRTVINEEKNTPRVETLQVFVSKPIDNYFNGKVSLNTLNSFNKEKVADYFTQKLIEDNLIKINDRGDFYEATLTIVKE
jgi:hypothetical protein